MGKIEISDDLRNKLDKLLLYKSKDMEDTAVGPAPSWKPPPPPPPPPPFAEINSSQQQPPQKPQQPHQSQQPTYLPEIYSKYYVKNNKNKYKKKKDKIKYYKITKIVFFSSVVAGIGVTLGLKIANILFF
jgi:hypothetical protein